MSTGVIYIATGEEFVAEARNSARSLKQAVPGVSICLISDVQEEHPEFDGRIVVDDPHYGFRDKVEYMSESPYDKTIYLDTDVHVYSDISNLFNILDEFDVAAAHNGAGISDRRETYDIEEIPDSFPEYNTGIVAYDTGKMSEFATEWKTAYIDDHPHDQPSFRKALYQSDLRIATLPPEYNCLFREPGHVVGTVKIFHGRILNIESKGAGRYYDLETAIESINETTTNRVFVPKATGGFDVHSAGTLAKRIRLSIIQYGIRGTIRKSIQTLRSSKDEDIQSKHNMIDK